MESGPLFHLLNSERDLVLPEQSPSAGGLLAMGGADFDRECAELTLELALSELGEENPQIAAGSSYRGERPGCLTLQSAQFLPLPHSREEAASVAVLFREAAAPHEALLLTGAAANEAAFKQMAPGRRILHLATHGFFLRSDCAGSLAGTRSIGGLVASSSDEADTEIDDPLLLSGLALAGANTRASAGADDEDGILTADEIAALDLEDVEWAVLSACDSGVGEVLPREGVFGLRRAFKLAGVRCVITSLWAVGDEPALDWMTHLYDARFNRHASTAEAMQMASRAVLDERRSAGLSTHPRHWGGFVAVGDWR